MKVIAERPGQHLLVPDGAEPDDEDATGLVVHDDGTAEEVDPQAAIARGYWGEPSGDADPDELLPDDVEPLEAEAKGAEMDWRHTEGPRGGDVWVNTETGERVRQEPPGWEADAEDEGRDKLERAIRDLEADAAMGAEQAFESMPNTLKQSLVRWSADASGEAVAGMMQVLGTHGMEAASTLATMMAEEEDGPETTKEGGSWVPYKGPKGGEGWENTESGEKVYEDEPPGDVDLSSLEEYELVNVAFDRFDLSEEETRDLIDEVDSRDDFEDIVRDRIVPDGATTSGPSDSGSAIGAKALSEGDEVLIEDKPAEVTTKKEMGPGGYFIAGETADGEKVTARVSKDADFEEVVTSTAGPVRAEAVSEGDKIVIDGERVEVERASDMGGGFYIAGRDDQGEVHTARVGPDVEFDSWDEGGDGPEHDLEQGMTVIAEDAYGDEIEVTVEYVDEGSGTFTVESLEGEFEISDVVETLPDVDFERGDRIEFSGDIADDSGRLLGVDPSSCGQGEVEIELQTDEATRHYCASPEDLEEHPEGKYETTGGFDEELAAAVRSGDPMGTSDIYRNMGKVDDPWLVADALEQELAGPDRKTARERLASKLGTFAEGPTEEEVRARLSDDGPVGEPPGDPPTGGYPSDVYDSAEEELEALAANSNTATGATARYSSNGRGGYDLDKIRRFHEHADTETLEQIVEDEWSGVSGKPASEKGQMAAGLLHYRDDSDVTWEDAMQTDLDHQYVPADEEEIRQNANEAFDQLDPAVGALTATHIEEFKADTMKNSSWLGVWREGSKSLTIKTDERGGTSTTKHEIGHAVQYALGVSGRSSRDNTESRGSQDPANWDFDIDLARQPAEHAEEMADELEDEIERYKDRADDRSAYMSECRKYQRTNTNEFIAVTFQHWQHNRAKLEDKHPEMADFWDRHAGRGVATEEVTTDELSRGDRVNVVLEDGTELTNAKITKDYAGEPGYKLGPESGTFKRDEVRSLEVRTGDAYGVETSGEPADSYTAEDIRVSDKDALERELSGKTLEVEYESLGETRSLEGMEIDEVTDDTVWVRDPTKTGPASETNIPLDDLESLEAYDQ